jgi:hypothetical protein
MFGPARTLLMIASCVTALPAAAQAPLPTTAFDGTYTGVSAVSTRSEPGSCIDTAVSRLFLLH